MTFAPEDSAWKSENRGIQHVWVIATHKPTKLGILGDLEFREELLAPRSFRGAVQKSVDEHRGGKLGAASGRFFGDLGAVWSAF